jgi:hypothetical protein
MGTYPLRTLFPRLVTQPLIAGWLLGFAFALLGYLTRADELLGLVAQAVSVGHLFKPRREHLGRTRVKLFVEMGEFSPGVLEEELADENEGGSKHIDGQERDVGQDACRICAPKNELVRGEEFQFTSWFLSIGEFNSLSANSLACETGPEPVSHRGSPAAHRL